jgi:hypothetical protein
MSTIFWKDRKIDGKNLGVNNGKNKLKDIKINLRY